MYTGSTTTLLILFFYWAGVKLLPSPAAPKPVDSRTHRSRKKNETVHFFSFEATRRVRSGIKTAGEEPRRDAIRRSRKAERRGASPPQAVGAEENGLEPKINARDWTKGHARPEGAGKGEEGLKKIRRYQTKQAPSARAITPRNTERRRHPKRQKRSSGDNAKNKRSEGGASADSTKGLI